MGLIIAAEGVGKPHQKMMEIDAFCQTILLPPLATFRIAFSRLSAWFTFASFFADPNPADPDIKFGSEPQMPKARRRAIRKPTKATCGRYGRKSDNANSQAGAGVNGLLRICSSFLRVTTRELPERDRWGILYGPDVWPNLAVIKRLYNTI